MKYNIKKHLEKKGWSVGTAQDFLGLSDEETRYIEWRVALGNMLKEKRRELGYTQTLLAKKIGSSQSRVAKMETGDSSVSIDLIIRSLIHIGISNKEIGNYVSRL